MTVLKYTERDRSEIGVTLAEAKGTHLRRDWRMFQVRPYLNVVGFTSIHI
jgi:hypothetical protein